MRLFNHLWDTFLYLLPLLMMLRQLPSHVFKQSYKLLFYLYACTDKFLSIDSTAGVGLWAETVLYFRKKKHQ